MAMIKLKHSNYLLISDAVRTMGTYNPDEIFFIFEEQLYLHEADEIYGFLEWCHTNNKQFGYANYEDVFKEFKKSLK